MANSKFSMIHFQNLLDKKLFVRGNNLECEATKARATNNFNKRSWLLVNFG